MSSVAHHIIAYNLGQDRWILSNHAYLVQSKATIQLETAVWRIKVINSWN